MEKARNAAVEPQDFAEEDLKKKQEAENARKALEAKLNQLLEKGKKTGKLKFKDLEFLEDANADPELESRFYEALEQNGVSLDIPADDDALPPLDEDAPENLELEEIEEGVANVGLVVLGSRHGGGVCVSARGATSVKVWRTRREQTSR
jgi:hypothetical protein